MTHTHQHITSRQDLIDWLANHSPNGAVQRAIDRGITTHHGLFKGGWVVSTEYGGQTWVVGIRCMGVPPRLVCGLLKAVPVDDYVGGVGVLAYGDSPPADPPGTPTNTDEDNTDDQST